MPCVVHDTVNLWGAQPPPLLFHKANRAKREVELLIAHRLGDDAPFWCVRIAGSVLNGTATVCSSDVDLHVIRNDRFAHQFPPGLRRDARNRALGCRIDCGFPEHRTRLEAVFEAVYGASALHRPKALQIVGNDHRLDADVIIGLEHRRFICEHRWHEGVELRGRGDNETRVICFPELRRRRIETHDRSAHGRYRPVVRILKCVRRHFRASGEPFLYQVADEIPSCLVEAILACIPANLYWEQNACHFPVLDRVLPAAIKLLSDPNQAQQLQDLDGLTPLFGPDKTWSREQLLVFLHVAHHRLQAHNIPLTA